MSEFSNPAGRASGTASKYIAALLDLVGGQDPRAVQAELLGQLRSLTAGMTQAQLTTPEAPGKWSVAQVVDHLVDQEIVNSFRLRSIVAEPDPALRGYDQDQWAARLRYGQTPVSELLQELEMLRRRNLRLLATLAPDEWERAGMHSERGRETARRLCALTAAHDLVHRRQIERIRDQTCG